VGFKCYVIGRPPDPELAQSPFLSIAVDDCRELPCPQFINQKAASCFRRKGRHDRCRGWRRTCRRSRASRAHAGAQTHFLIVHHRPVRTSASRLRRCSPSCSLVALRDKWAGVAVAGGNAGIAGGRLRPNRLLGFLWQKRLTEARIWSADLVHLNGLGF
jgi:hypothetical protein